MYDQQKLKILQTICDVFGQKNFKKSDLNLFLPGPNIMLCMYCKTVLTDKLTFVKKW